MKDMQNVLSECQENVITQFTVINKSSEKLAKKLNVILKISRNYEEPMNPENYPTNDTEKYY